MDGSFRRKGKRAVQPDGRYAQRSFWVRPALGVSTCVGTETPLVISDAVKERLKSSGQDPSDPAIVEQLYEGIFQRITKAYLLDYYWLWTPEGWTWGDPKDSESTHAYAP